MLSSLSLGWFAVRFVISPRAQNYGSSLVGPRAPCWHPAAGLWWPPAPHKECGAVSVRHRSYGAYRLRLCVPARMLEHKLAAVSAEFSQPAETQDPTRRRSLYSWLTDPSKRKRLASLGTAGALSYLYVKVLKHMVLSSITWYLVAARTGLPPLQRWPTFLSIYASLYLAASPLQPAKFALVVALTPVTDKLAHRLSARLKVSKNNAFGLVLLAGGVLGGALWAMALSLAGLLAGVAAW